jgi:hypothetical protein
MSSIQSYDAVTEKDFAPARQCNEVFLVIFILTNVE